MCWTPRSCWPRTTPSPTPSRCCPSGRTAPVWWWRTAARSAWSPSPTCPGVDRFTQLSEVMSRDLLLLDADIDPREAFNRLEDGHRRLAPAVDADGRLAGILTRKAALRATLYTPATDAAGRLRIAAAVGINGDVAGKAKALLAAGADVIVVDTAHGHQESMLAAVARGARAGPGRPVGGRQRGRRRGGARPGRGGRRHRQGRRGPGRDVHHPDDDRRRPPAVLRGAGVRRRGPQARQARLGGRRGAPPARRCHGAGRRRLERDDRLLVRRHPRIPRRPPARRERPALQGELRDGLGPRGAQPHQRGVAPTTGPARRCSRRASPPPGCTWTRRGPGSRT